MKQLLKLKIHSFDKSTSTELRMVHHHLLGHLRGLPSPSPTELLQAKISYRLTKSIWGNGLAVYKTTPTGLYRSCGMLSGCNVLYIQSLIVIIIYAQ